MRHLRPVTRKPKHAQLEGVLQIFSILNAVVGLVGLFTKKNQ